MYTIMSWYLPATKKATQENFLAAIRKWLTKGEISRYGFDLSFLPDESCQSCIGSSVGENAKFNFVCAEDENCVYSSFVFERAHPEENYARYLECILVNSKIDDDHYFVAHLKKNIINENASFNHDASIENRLPSFINSLIEDRLAMKERFMYSNDVMDFGSEDASQLLESELNLYPILIVNQNKLDHSHFTPYSSICHIISDKFNGDWKCKLSFNRLRTELTFENDLVPHIIHELFYYVNVGVSTHSSIDHEAILRIFEKGYVNKKIHITDSMVEKIKDARKKKGLTQGELADYIASIKGNDTPFNSLFISRIESRRQKRIESEKLSVLEEILDLPIGYLSAGDRPGEHHCEKPSMERDSSPKFCMMCGSPLPQGKSPRFCPYCGEPLQ